MNEQKKIVVVGGNAAGPAAAAKAKRTDPNAEVILFEAGKYISTGTCELPYVLSGEIDDYKKVVFFDEETFAKEKGVKVFTRHLVENIDRHLKKIIVKDINKSELVEFYYDKLILATGSKAKIPSGFPPGTKNIFTFKTVSDYLQINEFIKSNSVKNVLILGAGYIGLELCESFKKIGAEVTLVEKFNLPMPGAESEIQHLILDSLNANKISFVPEYDTVKFIFKDNNCTSIRFDGWNRKVDLVVSAIGFKPNIDLAIQAKLDIGKLTGFKVNNKQATSDQNIYAAGDNTEVYNFITGKPDYFPIATIAHMQGHVAGSNAGGGNEFTKPIVKNIAVKIFDKTLCTVGITSREADEYCFKYTAVQHIAPNLVSVMPQSGKTYGKILFEKDSGKILGASFWGNSEVIGYGDLISSYIRNGIKINKLAEIDFNYTPPRSPFVNLLSILGRKSNKEN